MGTPAYLAPEVIAAQPGKSYNAEVRAEHSGERAAQQLMSRLNTGHVIGPWHNALGPAEWLACRQRCIEGWGRACECG